MAWVVADGWRDGAQGIAEVSLRCDEFHEAASVRMEINRS
jgi:hypothetical protein